MRHSLTATSVSRTLLAFLVFVSEIVVVSLHHTLSVRRGGQEEIKERIPDFFLTPLAMLARKKAQTVSFQPLHSRFLFRLSTRLELALGRTDLPDLVPSYPSRIDAPSSSEIDVRVPATRLS